MGLAAAAPALLLRLGLRARTSLVVQLCVIGAGLGFNALLTDALDPITVLYLALLPMLALLALGRRAAVVAFVASCAVAAGVTVAHARGLQLGVVHHGLGTSVIADVTMYVVFAGLFTALALLYDALRVRAVAEAERAAQSRSLFLANISHELRTPMNGVVGMTDLLARTELSKAQRDQVDVIRRSGEALVALINDLLDYTKLETGNVRLERVAFVPRQLLDDSLALFKPAAQKKGLALVGEATEAVPPALLGDALRLKQIVTNLVSNAVKFTAQGGVHVSLDYQAGSLVLLVDDEGIGIGDDTAKVLFRPFIQGDESTTRRYGGTGLGLAICHQLATQMGGSIGLESKKGQGTSFRVTLPLPATQAPDAEEPSGPVARPVPVSAAQLPRALVVEDNHINQLVLTSMLVREGYACTVAEHGQAAVDALRAGTFAIVLMDCQMPVMDGFEATRRIRALAPPAADTPIIAITASAMSDDVDRCLACGMNAVLAKPVTLATLRPVLARYVGAARINTPGESATP
jgi:signal transduction histidine kinase/ActR/RegA family two-component response regulator